MAALSRIKIKGYKSIRELDLPLHSLNVLIGANGSGKTNFISLFRLLNQIVEQNLEIFVPKSGGAQTLLYFGEKMTSEIAMRFEFGNNVYEARFAPTTDDKLIFTQERCWYTKTGIIIDLGKGHKETGLVVEARQFPGKVADHVLDAFKSWKVYHFHDTSDTALVKQSGNIHDTRFLRPDASNLAAFLYWMQQKRPNNYGRIIETIRLVAPFFGDFILRPSPFNEDTVRLEWREAGSDFPFNAHALSDGTLRFICLTTLLSQPNLPSTILIDEPELGLHPYAITLLASMLQSAATETQVIVSTQSVPLVNQFAPEDIVVVDREDNQSVFRRLQAEAIETWLDDYGIGDLWEKNVLGGRPQ